MGRLQRLRAFEDRRPALIGFAAGALLALASLLFLLFQP
jgi:hypothetical protein